MKRFLLLLLVAVLAYGIVVLVGVYPMTKQITKQIEYRTNATKKILEDAR